VVAIRHKFLAECDLRSLGKTDKIKKLAEKSEIRNKDIAEYFNVTRGYVSQLKKVSNIQTGPRGRPKKVPEEVIEEMICFIEEGQSAGNCPKYMEVTAHVSTYF